MHGTGGISSSGILLLSFLMIALFNNQRLQSYATTLDGQHSSDFPLDLDTWDNATRAGGMNYTIYIGIVQLYNIGMKPALDPMTDR